MSIGSLFISTDLLNPKGGNDDFDFKGFKFEISIPIISPQSVISITFC